MKKTEAREFAIYPNPTQDKVNIQYAVNADEVVYMELYDVLGKKQLRKQLKEGNKHSIDLSLLKNGIYFFRLIKADKSVESGKLVIEYDILCLQFASTEYHF
jgi:hypothetical protein